MNFLGLKLSTLVLGVFYLLSTTQHLPVLLTAAGAHSISFEQEHGVEHLVLAHDHIVEFSPSDGWSDFADHADHEFHFGAAKALPRNQQQLPVMAACLVSYPPTFSLSPEVSRVPSDIPAPDTGPPPQTIFVLRI